ncbi:hypothetical protein CWB99_05825 [Pseudoalteromonas rubra]|uniref:Uncharacterized protein n=1 Tax=Pseudoalteromonas rubra TaxID=43658 RepID=A0A5S3WRM9_9GAMM|nr:hypothetical protein [Pseudoalteromonas rubra]TMP30849.1 hypothetical protein CWB99_05825 [Pseudoalteromonas rubra]TMP34216.1 hypothetical protein CWC00_08650 [Pseudoalteromonas rubra]
MKKLKALAIVAGTLFTGSAFAANLTCSVYVANGGFTSGNGTSSCSGVDFTNNNSARALFSIGNVSKSIKEIRWSGISCTGGIACNTRVRAFSSASASALILYKDGTWEKTNTATASYENEPGTPF